MHEDWIGVHRRKDAQCDPTGLLDLDIPVQVIPISIGGQILLSDGLAIDDQFDRNRARGSDAAALDVPIRFFVESTIFDFERLFGLGGR